MSDMKMAYTLAAAAVRERLAEQHPDDLGALLQIQPGTVAAYSGPMTRWSMSWTACAFRQP